MRDLQHLIVLDQPVNLLVSWLTLKFYQVTNHGSYSFCRVDFLIVHNYLGGSNESSSVLSQSVHLVPTLFKESR